MNHISDKLGHDQLSNETQHTRWRSRLSFIFAASAAAIGLGNIWRFPFVVGENGGGAFVFIYLICVIILGIPLLITEIMMGRIGRHNPAKTFASLAEQSNQPRFWKWAGGLTILAGFLILSYYTVITGWVVDYMARAAVGQFTLIPESASVATFQALQKSHWQMLLTDTIVIMGAVSVNILGIKRGLERAVLIIFPLLLILMLLLLGYSITSGGFHTAVIFLFKPDLHELSARTILVALGQAFFSLNIAMGITMMFSAYLPKKTPIPSAAITIALADTGFALLAGLIIFPIVFANHLQPAAGPSLIFQTLPIAFGKMPAGSLIGTLFFIMLFFAAFTSVIALLEPTISWLEETWHLHRKYAVLISACVCWLLSFGTIASFRFSSHFHLFGITFFDAIDYLTASFMLPIGGLLIAVFSGWFLDKTLIYRQLQWRVNGWHRLWISMLRYFAPVAILFILLAYAGVL